MKTTIAVVLLLACVSARADYADCILDKMPGTANAQAAFAVHRSCLNEFPRYYSGIYKGINRGMFAFKDSEACIIKMSRETPQPNAALIIAIACRCLYDRPAYEGQTCSDPQ